MRVLVVWLVILGSIAAVGTQAAQVVKGTVLSGTHESLVISTDADRKSIMLKPSTDAVIQRGQVGRELRKASLLDFAPGDRVVAVVKQDGSASSIKGYYSVARGTVRSATSEKIIMDDGKSVLLRPNLQVVFAGGRMGKPAELKPGTLVLCRLNPLTQEAWMVVATETVTPVKPTVPKVKPVIKSVTYVAPSPLKVRDWMRVDVEGTPGGRATCQVKGLIPVTVMTEKEPGKYRASVMIPSGKPVKDAPLIARLTVGSLEAEPVQAAKLITVEPETVPTPMPKPTSVAVTQPQTPRLPEPTIVPTPEPVSVPKPEAEPAAAAEPQAPTASVESPIPPAAPVAPEPPKAKAPIVITAPANLARIQRSIMITGTAEPRSQVLIKITYTNGLEGVLEISGQVISQLVAVDDKGQFALGPLPLEGPLATRGLIFTTEAWYPEAAENIVKVTFFGDRR